MSNIKKLPESVNAIKAYHQLATAGVHDYIAKNANVFFL